MELKSSTESSVGVTRTTKEAVAAIFITQKQMDILQEDMANISSLSRAIEKIIVEIT